MRPTHNLPSLFRQRSEASGRCPPAAIDSNRVEHKIAAMPPCSAARTSDNTQIYEGHQVLQATDNRRMIRRERGLAHPFLVSRTLDRSWSRGT
jgi:hypothetical protein